MSRNPSQTLATVIVAPRQRCIRLPATLWAELFIGDRLVVESDNGEWLMATVELGFDDAPQLELPCSLDAEAQCRIRRPRTA